MTISEPPRLTLEQCEDLYPQHPTDVVMACSPDPVLTHDGRTSQACRRCNCGQSSAHVELCNRPEAVVRRERDQARRDVLATRPLGIADITEGVLPSDPRAGSGWWYWCRQHERAEKPNEPTYILAQGDIIPVCIRIGPFMSEFEAKVLAGCGHDEEGCERVGHGPLSMYIQS